MSELSRPENQLELPGLGHKQAMMATQGELSPKAAMIAAQIPRIEPMLRTFEKLGFIVVGLNEEPSDEELIENEPIHLAGTSPGIQAFHKLLTKQGYAVTRSTNSERKAVQA